MYVGLTEELFWNIMEAGRKVGEEKVEQRNKKECVKRIVEEKSSLSNSWKDQFDEYYEDYLDALRTEKLYESFREQGGEEDELFEGVIRGIVARGKEYYDSCLKEGIVLLEGETIHDLYFLDLDEIELFPFEFTRGDVKISFPDMIYGENGLLVELRCKNSFNERIFADIKKYLMEHLSEWKVNSCIPLADAVAIFNLIDQLSGGSRFWSEELELRIEDAVLEIQDIICILET